MASVSCNGCNSPAVPPYFGPTPIIRTTTETLPTWAIVVIVFGILLILILIAVIIFCLCRLGCWCCAAADSDDERKKKKTSYGWYGRRRSAAIGSKRPQILYRYPDDDAAVIVARNGDADSSSSGYVPRALRLTNDRRPKTVRVVEDVNFNDDGRPVVFVDGGRSSVIGGSTLSSSRVLRGGYVDAEDVRSDIVYGSRPHPAVITINGQGISSYGGDGVTSGGYGHGHEGVLGSHSASIQVVGGHGSPWSAAPVPSIYPAL